MSAMIRGIVSIALLGALSLASAQGAPGEWEVGKHYFLVDPVQATSTGDKIEVTEVFSYGCPACNASYPFVDKLRKALPPNAAMNYVPAAFNPNEDWPMFQRAYFAAKALGVADKAHDAMFDAVWKSGELAIMDKATNALKKPQPTIEDAARFYANYGAKAEDFLATANSFTISTRMKQADAYIKATAVDSTPTIIVNGKYRLTTKSAAPDSRDWNEAWNKTEQLVLYLVRKESGGK
jgi:protein dithiol oxidoreductase (disulfide-forming)